MSGAFLERVSSHRARLLGLAPAAWLVLASCTVEASAPPPVARALEGPAPAGSFAPNLASTSGGILLSWLETSTQPGGEDDGHVLRFAGFDADGATWSAPVTIASGGAFFANWADFPSLVEVPGGLLAHWLERTGADTYAYGVRLARSADGGATWEPLGLLHDDRSPTEHGFVSWARATRGLQAFWLDGRAMVEDGPMSLRTTMLPSDPATLEGRDGEAPASTVLDRRVCECCQTDAALASGGPIVVYRDRSDREVRDIAIVRRTADGWSEPSRVAEDGWVIAGCPVNGPAVAATEDVVVVAWFTAAGGEPAVKAALSRDGGASFAAPIVVDAERPLGRVDVVLDGETAWVSWLARVDDDRALVRLRRIEVGPRDGAGRPGPASDLALTGGARAAGFPRLAALGPSRLLVAWVDTTEGQRVRTAIVESAR